MLEALFIRMIPSFVEVIHVELADEWRKIVMFEVAREDALSELVGLFYHKAVTWVAPTNYMVQAGVL
jgi:hypothetical protein